jgi:hypothetical protein
MRRIQVGQTKDFGMSVSYAMGFEGEINEIVKEIGSEIIALAFLRRTDPAKAVIGQMKLAKKIREKRQLTDEQKAEQENAHDEALFLEGKLCKRVCCVCKKVIGYKEGSGVTHGYCEPCYKEAMAEVNVWDALSASSAMSR